jgi:alpha-ketoglutarate-dependent taurine dioxygenase
MSGEKTLRTGGCFCDHPDLSLSLSLSHDHLCLHNQTTMHAAKNCSPDQTVQLQVVVVVYCRL